MMGQLYPQMNKKASRSRTTEVQQKPFLLTNILIINLLSVPRFLLILSPISLGDGLGKSEISHVFHLHFIQLVVATLDTELECFQGKVWTQRGNSADVSQPGLPCLPG